MNAAISPPEACETMASSGTAAVYFAFSRGVTPAFTGRAVNVFNFNSVLFGLLPCNAWFVASAAEEGRYERGKG